MEELQKRGLDKDGKHAGNGTWRGAGKKNGLYGTLEMGAFETLAVAEWGEVRRQVGLMVETMEKMCVDWTKGHKKVQRNRAVAATWQAQVLAEKEIEEK